MHSGCHFLYSSLTKDKPFSHPHQTKAVFFFSVTLADTIFNLLAGLSAPAADCYIISHVFAYLSKLWFLYMVCREGEWVRGLGFCPSNTERKAPELEMLCLLYRHKILCGSAFLPQYFQMSVLSFSHTLTSCNKASFHSR